MERTLNFERLVDEYYQHLYRFGLGLCGNPDVACDLTQETFYLAIKNAHQLRNTLKVRSWLFTILYRAYLQKRRHETRFPHRELDLVAHELPAAGPECMEQLDAKTVVLALSDVDEIFRVPLVLFYLKDMSYREIGEFLHIPLGTVMSRLARGKAMLHQRLEQRAAPGSVVAQRGADRQSGSPPNVRLLSGTQ